MASSITKKDLIKKKRKSSECHMEGKHFCDCLIRNIRKWLGRKRYGKENIQEEKFV